MDEAEVAFAPLTPAVVERLVSGHREFLRFLEARVGSRAEAEDILQEAFVKGIERSAVLSDDESITAWCYRTLRNAVIDRYRRRASSSRTLAAFAEELEVQREPEPAVANAVCACVGELAATLKPEYAEALRRIDVEGQSVRDYAAAVGVQPNNAGVRVHRARRALRERVLACCGTCADHGCLDCTCGPSARAEP